jgi:FMN phosphatase YigB (HAD superfamily)
MMIKTLVFDFGNVVGFFSHRRATERLAPHGDLAAADLHAFLFGGDLELDYELGRIETPEFIARARKGAGLRCPDDYFRRAYADIFWPNRAVCDLLPRLAGAVRLVLLSNTNDLHAEQFLVQFAEELRPFTHLVLSHQAGARKPQREIYERARGLAGCRADEMLFVDDLEANVAGARALGWHGVVYRDAADLARNLADHGMALSPRSGERGYES